MKVQSEEFLIICLYYYGLLIFPESCLHYPCTVTHFFCAKYKNLCCESESQSCINVNPLVFIGSIRVMKLWATKVAFVMEAGREREEVRQSEAVLVTWQRANGVTDD